MLLFLVANVLFLASSDSSSRLGCSYHLFSDEIAAKTRKKMKISYRNLLRHRNLHIPPPSSNPLSNTLVGGGGCSAQRVLDSVLLFDVF